jgi:hypothetical protein
VPGRIWPEGQSLLTPDSIHHLYYVIIWPFAFWQRISLLAIDLLFLWTSHFNNSLQNSTLKNKLSENISCLFTPQSPPMNSDKLLLEGKKNKKDKIWAICPTQSGNGVARGLWSWTTDSSVPPFLFSVWTLYWTTNGGIFLSARHEHIV